MSSFTNTGNIYGTNEKVEFEFKYAVPSIDVPSSSTNESNIDDHHDDGECDEEPLLLFNNKEMIILLLGTELEDKSESQPYTLMII